MDITFAGVDVPELERLVSHFRDLERMCVAQGKFGGAKAFERLAEHASFVALQRRNAWPDFR